jgi:hypothetical protein
MASELRMTLIAGAFAEYRALDRQKPKPFSIGEQNAVGNSDSTHL